MSTARFASTTLGALHPGTAWLGWIARASHRLGWRPLALSALIHVLAGVFGPNGGVLLGPGRIFSDPIADFLLGRWLCRVLPLVFAAMVADEAYRGGVSPLRAYGVALVGGSLCAPWLDAFGGMLVGWGSATFRWNSLAMSMKQDLLQGGLCMAMYAYWRTRQRTLDALRDSEAQRLEDRRALFLSRLKSLQARVEPGFLFDVLSRVGKLHHSDPPAADALLTDLIALLRAMLPEGARPHSTVTQEFALVSAWARVENRLGRVVPIIIEADEKAQRANLGPMLVLPLLQEASTHPMTVMPNWRLVAEIRSDERKSGDRLRIRLTPSTEVAGADEVDPAEAPSLARVRDRLRELYDAEASLSVTHRSDGTWSFDLDLPCIRESSP